MTLMTGHPGHVALWWMMLLFLWRNSLGMIVNTSSGAVRGSCTSTNCVFFSIPFAQPPIGHLRFAPPLPAALLPDVRDGTTPGPACFQTPEDDGTIQSEDCLTVDVWMPRANSSDSNRHSNERSQLRPVLIFFYGGGALSGASSWYNFSQYANDGFVVFAANYRLGPLGFLALRELSDQSELNASGNYGLMDCNLAVQFVAANAKAFGGDKSTITIMGQSSGATMVWGLTAKWWSTSSRPFQRAIMLSGSPNISMDRKQAEVQNAPLPIALGCAAANRSTPAADVVRCLRAAPASAVSYGHRPINTTWQIFDSLTWGLPGPQWRHGFPLPGIVIVDGVFLRASLAESLSNGVAQPPIQLLVSNVAAEDDLAPNEDFSGNLTFDPLLNYVNERLTPWGGSDFGTDILTRFGFTALPPQQAYVQLASTLGVICGQLYLLRQAAHGVSNSNFFYIAVAEGPTHPQILGVRPGYTSRYAYHQYDLLWSMEQWDFFADFAFGPGNHPPYEPSTADLSQSLLLRQLYQSFASTGTPHNVPKFSSEPDRYSVGIVGKLEVRSQVLWHADFCDEMQRVGLWTSFWWAN